VDVAGSEAGDEHCSAAQKDRLGIESVFIEKALLFGEPERRQAGIHRRIADDELARSVRGIDGEKLHRQHDRCDVPSMGNARGRDFAW